jgi:RND family efflux transporter MFP subunit
MNDIRTNEDGLRAEIEELRRQLEAHKQPPKPSWRAPLVIVVLLGGLLAAGYYLGYEPRQRREMVLAAETHTNNEALPVTTVEKVERASARASLVLPANIQAATEAPVLARATGYLKKRYADIGYHVTAGQVLAEIEAPELNQQIRQAKAAVDQANSGTAQAEAAALQAKANGELARITADRWKSLFEANIVARQDYDTRVAAWEAAQANGQALDKAIAVAKSNTAAVEANLARLNDLLGYQTVRAPFEGVITVRNVDAGALVNEGNTLLYRIAQIGDIRTYLNVPQAYAGSIRTGQQATLTMTDLPGRKFVGKVARTANALDPSSRTLLAEVSVPNPTGILIPGMYAQVDLAIPRQDPPLVIPGDTLVIRSDGPQVAVVNAEGVIHYTKIQLGRDFGDRLEVLSGLHEGQQLAVNPSDSIREGVRVKPVAPEQKATKK